MSQSQKPQRLDAILSRYGYCSRSEARVWLNRGRVTVAGKVEKSPSEKALVRDVQVDGAAVEFPDGLLVLLYKPAGYVCSHDKKEGPSVYDLVPARWLERNPPVTTVGRLDKDTTGVLLITDDGDLVQRWTSPKHKVPKIYEVTLDKDLDPALIPLFASGQLVMEDDDKPCLPARLEIVNPREAKLELVEGKFHQVKRMFSAQGYEVVRLHRSRFGTYTLGDLSRGQWREVAVEAVP